MTERARRGMPPWAAFVLGALVVILAVGGYMLYRSAPAVSAQDAGIDLSLPDTPSLPPIVPAPDPDPIPLPSPTPAPG